MAHVEINPDNLIEDGPGGVLPFLATVIKQRIRDDDLDGLQTLVEQIALLSEQLLVLNEEIEDKKREYKRMRNRMLDLEEQERRQQEAREALMANMRAEFGLDDDADEPRSSTDSSDNLFTEDVADILGNTNDSSEFLTSSSSSETDSEWNDDADEETMSIFDFEDEEDGLPEDNFLTSFSADDEFSVDFDTGYQVQAPSMNVPVGAPIGGDPFDVGNGTAPPGQEDGFSDPFSNSGAQTGASAAAANGNAPTGDADDLTAIDPLALIDDEYYDDSPVDVFDEEGDDDYLEHLEKERRALERRKSLISYSDEGTSQMMRREEQKDDDEDDTEGIFEDIDISSLPLEPINDDPFGENIFADNGAEIGKQKPALNAGDENDGKKRLSSLPSAQSSQEDGQAELQVDEYIDDEEFFSL